MINTEKVKNPTSEVSPPGPIAPADLYFSSKRLGKN